jgi:hypothetical protein
MKTKLLLAVALLGLATLVSAATTPDPVPVPTELLCRVQAEIGTGTFMAFFEKSVLTADGIFRQPWESVSWQASDKKITAAGQTLTYSQVMELVVAIAKQERAEAQAAQTTPAPADKPASP